MTLSTISLAGRALSSIGATTPIGRIAYHSTRSDACLPPWGCRAKPLTICRIAAGVLDEHVVPPLITATVGQPVHLPVEGDSRPRLRVAYDDGHVADFPVQETPHGIALSPISKCGYHQLEVGPKRLTLAVAPTRCVTVSDIAPSERIWGLAAQIYGLHSPDDCGVGDMAGAVALAKAAAQLKADALALSPTHALFAADPNHFSPYSPSSRLFYNPMHADAAAIFGEAKIAKARSEVADNGTNTHKEPSLIDWRQSSRKKMAVFRHLFEDFFANEISVEPATALAKDFMRFCATHDAALSRHALFEALHASRLKMDQNEWNWQAWPVEWRDPKSPSVRRFAEKNKLEILFHSFLQWLADRSFAAAHQEIRNAGMRIGLIADLAVGMNSSGSAAWSEQKDVLVGLQIGAPPDLYNNRGQNWGLTTFSPRALRSSGFAPFIATLRACMRHAGGVRIDHAMGLMRLWVVPPGAEAKEGAYLAYPLDDLLRLTALEFAPESSRGHRRRSWDGPYWLSRAACVRGHLRHERALVRAQAGRVRRTSKLADRSRRHDLNARSADRRRMVARP